MRNLGLLLTTLLLGVVGGHGEAAADDGTIGLMFDAGVPDGVNGAVVWRATPRIRAHGGMGYNGISSGVRGGVSIAAFPYWITPTLTVDGGRYFDGDANVLAQMLSGDASFDEPLLRDVGYDYANAHVGIELGYSSMTFYLHAGMSAVQMQVQNANEALEDSFDSEDGPKLEVRSDPTLRIFAPSARTGFIYYF